MELWQFPSLKCNKATHSEYLVNGFCLAAECEFTPALCLQCMADLHKKGACSDSIKMIKDIPKLIKPLQQYQQEQLSTIQNIIQKLKELTTSIEQYYNPISKYIEEPNLANLNWLGYFLKKESQDVVSNLIKTAQNEIDSLFQQSTELSIKKEKTNPQERKLEPIPECKVFSNSFQQDKNLEAAVYLQNQGNELFEQKKYFEAINYYQQAIDKDPKNQRIWLDKGNILFDLKKHAYAIKYFENATQVDSNNRGIWLDKGNQLFNQNDFIYAKTYYENTIKTDPKNNDIFFIKGNQLFLSKQYTLAINYYEKAIVIDKTKQHIWLDKGNELFQIKEYSIAQDYYQKAVSVNNQNNNNIWLRKGDELYLLEVYTYAITYFEKAINLDPKNEQAIQNLQKTKQRLKIDKIN